MMAGAANNRLVGAACLAVTACCWGSLFPVAKAIMPAVDAVYLTAIRYGVAALFLVLSLGLSEGFSALRPEKGWLLALCGALGFAGFGLMGFIGINRVPPEHGAVIASLMPLITMLIAWLVLKQPPARFTLGSLVVALVGVLLVITRAHPSRLLDSGAGTGDLLVFGGVVCWVLYTLGGRNFPNWSPLRYTTLSCVFGVGAILLATAVATTLGLAHPPAWPDILSVKGKLAYLIVMPSIVAVLFWNVGILKLGALNGSLFMNAAPVVTFLIGLAQGQHFEGVELAGAGLVLVALVANNLYLRHRTAEA